MFSWIQSQLRWLMSSNSPDHKPDGTQCREHKAVDERAGTSDTVRANTARQANPSPNVPVRQINFEPPKIIKS